MSRSTYYEEMRKFARDKRTQYAVTTASLNLTAVRKIYKQEGIVIDQRPLGARIRAAYFCDEGDVSVLVNKNLPKVPRLFALVHELKHHYTDQIHMRGGNIRCGDYNANRMIEIGAEEFAAEFIYPEDEMLALLSEMAFFENSCTPERIIMLKRSCSAPVSYKFLVKRLERFGLCETGEFEKIPFQKREEEIYGRPFYKEEWYKKYRKRKAHRPASH